MPKQRKTSKRAGKAASKVLKDKITSRKSKIAAGQRFTSKSTKEKETIKHKLLFF